MDQMPDKKNDPPKQPLSPADKKKISDMAKYLARAVSQSHDFGINHPLAKKPIEDAFTLLNNFVQEKGSVALYIAEKKLRYGDTVLEERNPVVDKLISLFMAVKVVSVEFEQGFNKGDFLNFLSIFATRSQEIMDAGGIEKLFKDKNIGHLKLNPIKYELIGMDEKVISGAAKISDEDLSKELEKIFAKTEEEAKASEEIDPEEQLLSLIDPALREETDLSFFVDKLAKDPLDEVHSIIEAVHLVNKVGGEKAKKIISVVTKKLDLVRDELYMCMVNNKEDEKTKQIYKSASVLGKELTRQIKTIQVSQDLTGPLEEMTNVVMMILDQAEAQKMLSGFLKGEVSLKKKVAFLKSVIQRAKVSPDFEFMIKKLLNLKGMPEEEVKLLMEQRLAILEEFEKQQEMDLSQEFKPALQKLVQNQLDVEQVTQELNEIISRAVESEMKTATKKLRSENERLDAQTKVFNAVFSNLDQGVAIFDAEEKIIFINKIAEQILGAGAGKKLNSELSAVLKTWQSGQTIDSEFSNILSGIKAIQKNESGQLSSILFKGLS